MTESRTGGAEIARIYCVVLSVGICCSLAIVTTFEVTRPIIARNRTTLRKNAVFDLLPGATTIVSYRFDPNATQFIAAPGDADGSEVFFAGLDRQGELVGVALETQGVGYQDMIRLLYAYSLDEQAITGIRVLESRETPGLGDRIETDEDFLSNFVQLDVSLAAGENELAHPIEFVKPGSKTSPWQIDGITGATISSQAVAEMLRESTVKWIPRVGSRSADFTKSLSEKGSDPLRAPPKGQTPFPIVSKSDEEG